MPKAKKTQETVENRVWKTAVGVLIALLLVGGIMAIIIMAWDGNNAPQENDATVTMTLSESGDLIVPFENLTEEFQKIDYGGPHNLIFWRDEDSNIYTAFNACQECYTRGNARYTYQNGTLRCQACGNQMDVHTMRNAAWGGCQPLAIPAAYRADIETEIVIPAKLLTYSAEMFNAWDTGDFSTTLENYTA